MPDLRVRVADTANVEASGNARLTKTWHLTNLSTGELDLTNFRFFVDVTSRDITVESLLDGEGNELDHATESLGPDKTRINCYFDVTLRPQQQYALTLVYRHPRYLLKLPDSSAWMLIEYFERLGPLEDVNFSQEEPEQLEFVLTIQDPRTPHLLGVRNPFAKWTVEISEQCDVRYEGATCVATYSIGLRENDRTPHINVLSLVSNRSAAMVVTTTSGGAIAAVVIERFLEALF